MANERMQEMIDITLAGKEYRVGCTPDNQAALFEAVNFLNGRLRDMNAHTGASGEKLAMMTALNIVHDFLQFQHADGFDMNGLRRRIEVMGTRIDEMLNQHPSGGFPAG